MAVINTSMYGGEVTLNFESLTHRYTLGGKRIPSVTTILGETSAKPALLFWASNCASDYWRDNIKPGEKYDEIQIEKLWKEAKKAHTTKKEDAAAVGSLSHRFVEDFIRGKSPQLPTNEISRAACQRFLDWVKEHDVKFLSAEQMIYSREHNYCGQADFFCVIDGKLYLGDLKTSNAIYDEYLEQVCAYKQARSEEYKREVFDGCVIVRVGKTEGELEVKYVTDMDKYIKTFNARVSFYHLLQESKSVDKYTKK
jgi:hypothetical protein